MIVCRDDATGGGAGSPNPEGALVSLSDMAEFTIPRPATAKSPRRAFDLANRHEKVPVKEEKARIYPFSLAS